MFRGETVGRFTLVRPLYRRDVFQARDGRRHVAIELIKTDRTRLRIAVATASRLDHPNLCHVRELIELPEHCAIVMDLHDGATLSDRLLLGPLDSTQAIALVRQLLEGLAHLHAAGVAHGSVMAEHALISERGKLVLIDIGVRTGTIAEDVERAASLAYSMLTGDRTGDIQLANAAPLGRWIERCLGGDFPDAGAALAALETPELPFVPVEKTTPIPVATTEPIPVVPPRSRKRTFATLGAIAVIATGIGIVASQTGGRTIYEPAPPRVAVTDPPDRPINRTGRPPLPTGAVEPTRPTTAYSLSLDPPKPRPIKAPPVPVIAAVPGAALGEVLFSAESTWIETPAIAILDQVHKQLIGNKLLRIQIIGHSSADGSDAKNREKSYARAIAVKNYFLANGIDAGRLDVVARGADAPIGDNQTSDGRAKNRRVEIRALAN